MKQLIFKLIIPLTVISFATITKWWYALPIDAPDTLFAGFPFPFVCKGWHTSMSLQIFVTELFTDLLTYFLFWCVLIFCIDHFGIKIKTNKIVTIVLWSLTAIVISGATLIASNPDNLFYVKRPFDMDIMETGYKFFALPGLPAPIATCPSTCSKLKITFPALINPEILLTFVVISLTGFKSVYFSRNE